MLNWEWNLANLCQRTSTSEEAVAKGLGIPLPHLSRLQGTANARVGKLIAVYRVFAHVARMPAHDELPERPVTLHDILRIDGVPPLVSLPTRERARDAVPVAGIDRAWWNLAWLRREIAHATDAPMSQELLAKQAGVNRSTLVRLENSLVDGRVSTLVTLYSLGRRSIATLTLHDLLIVAPE